MQRLILKTLPMHSNATIIKASSHLKVFIVQTMAHLKMDLEPACQHSKSYLVRKINVYQQA